MPKIRLTESELVSLIKKVIDHGNQSKLLNEEYPYDNLKQKRTPELIAKVIKDSQGTFNDNEAWAEAAFASIWTKQEHDRVRDLLGVKSPFRVINYLRNFMNDDEFKRKFRTKPIWEHEKYLLSLEPKNNQSTPQKIQSSIPKDNTLVKKNNLVSTPSKEVNGYFIYVIFPHYQPSMDGSSEIERKTAKLSRIVWGGKDRKKYGATGHAIFIIVDKYGYSHFFEFGPYGKGKKGMVRQYELGKLTQKKLSDYDIETFKAITEKSKKYTIGNTRNEIGKALVFKLPDSNKSLVWARSNIYTDYKGYDFMTGKDKNNPGGAANCATFGLDALQAGGVSVPKFCSPFPEHIYNSIKFKSMYKFET